MVTLVTMHVDVLTKEVKELFYDTKSRKSKNRQYNGQNKKDNRINVDLQNITQKLWFSENERVNCSCSTSGTHPVALVTSIWIFMTCRWTEACCTRVDRKAHISFGSGEL